MNKLRGVTKRITAMMLSGMLIIGLASGSVFASEMDTNPGKVEIEDSVAEEVDEEAMDAGAEQEAQYYAVTLDANGGCFVNEWDDVLGEYIESTEILNKQIPVGGTVMSFPVFETDDQDSQTMTFSGWSLERDREPVSQGDEEYTPVDNCVLYAVWEPEVILDNDEETDMQESEEAERVPEDDSLEEQEDTEDNPDDTENKGDTEDFSDGSMDTVEKDPERGNGEERSADIIEEGKEKSVRTDAMMSTVKSGECGDNLTWTLDDNGTLTINGTGAMTSYPWGPDYKSDIRTVVIENGVTEICAFAFSLCQNLTSVTIPDSVMYIGRQAFASCPSLAEIMIPSSVTYIGKEAFRWCSSLVDVTLPTNNLDLGNAFWDTPWWNNITSPNGFKIINGILYEYSGNSKNVVVPTSVYSISGSAFSNCSTINSVVIPSSVNSIGTSAFYNCTNLTSVTIPSSVDIIGASAFGNCTSLTSVTITSGVGSIGDYAFKGCTGLTSVTIPSSVDIIGASAFENCTSLTSVTITSGVGSIGGSAFKGCTGLMSVTIPNGVTTIGVYAFENCTNITQVSLPNSITSIGEAAFRRCTSLNTITIPGGIENIGSYIFKDCASLTSVSIQEGVKSIGYWSFYGCEKLTEINFPSTLTSIGNTSFGCCKALKSVTIPKNVNSIITEYANKKGIHSAFAGAEQLTEIKVDSGNSIYKSYDGCLYNSDLTSLLYCPEGKTKLSIYPSTQTIDESSLRIGIGEGDVSVSKLEEIDFGTCSPSISSYTFYNLTATAYYNNFLGNWPSEKRQSYGGAITWVEKPLNLSDCTMTFSPSSYTYDGTEKKPTITIKYNGTNLTNNTDYTVYYANNINAGTGTVTATGKGYFAGTLSKNFTISKASPALSFASSSVSKKTSDSAFTNTITKKTDGIVTFSSSNTSVATVNSSTGQVTIKGAGSATITANASAGANYNAGSASYTLTVVRQYTVSYDANGGTGTPSSQFKQENVSLVLSNIKPTKRYTIAYNSCGGSVSPASKSIDCTFKNWNTAKNGSGTSYASGGIYNANADSTLYAQWTNPKVGELATPMRSGYSFAGWYTASSGGNQITDSSIITGDVTLYAHWKDPYNLGDETYSFKNYKDYHADGHCFGMSITSAGYENNLLDIKRIGGNENTPLYSFDDTPNVRNPICYYQGKQGSYREYATVAGGSHYLYGVFNISSDWQEVVNYVKSHKYDNTGLLQIGIRKRKSDGGLGGHAVNFLRYESVNGQDRLYAYDNNHPNQETYFYRDTSGNVLQAPVQTFRGAIDCICLRDTRAYFSKVPDFDATHVVYMDKDAASIDGYSYTYMDTGFFDNDYIMYEIPADQEKVTIVPNKDYADFVYLDTEFSFEEITEATRGELRFSSLDDQEGGADTSFIIYEEEAAIIPTVTLSKSDFTYNGKEQKPTVTVKAGSTVLKEANDYSIEYPSGMINVGAYKVTVTLKGNYSGVLFATFNINKAAQSLTVKSTASSIAMGKTATVSTTGNKGKVTYKSSNTAIATVNPSTGVVTGKKAGTVTITATSAATSNYNTASKTVKITVTAGKSLKKPGNCHFAKWNNAKYTSCQIAWNKVAGADGYQTLLSWTNGTHASATIVQSNVLYRNCTVHPQHVSQMKVRAFYNEGGKRVFGPWSNIEYITPSPAKLTAKNASSGSNLKMNLSWNIIYGCNGYNVFITTNPNGTWYWNQSTSTNATATSAVITKYRGSGLKKNTRYYVRIVTRRKRNGVFCTVPMPAKNTYVGSFIIK